MTRTTAPGGNTKLVTGRVYAALAKARGTEPGTALVLDDSVNAEIDLTEEQAREITDQIRGHLDGVWELITDAYRGRAWIALGYTSWDNYCDNEFGASRLRLPREDRAEIVASLRESGLSIRAIASATGVSTERVHNAIHSGVRNQTPEVDEDATSGDVIPFPPVITGLDNKSHPATKQRSDLAETRDDYYTPAHVVDAARIVMGSIDTDPASCGEANECVGARIVYTAQTNGLIRDWEGNVWCNPPFGQWEQWVPKILSEYKSGRVKAVSVLYHGKTEVNHCMAPLMAAADAIWIPTGRIKFWGGRASKAKSMSPRDGSKVLYLGPDRDAFAREFSALGGTVTYGQTRVADALDVDEVPAEDISTDDLNHVRDDAAYVMQLVPVLVESVQRLPAGEVDAGLLAAVADVLFNAAAGIRLLIDEPAPTPPVQAPKTTTPLRAVQNLAWGLDGFANNLTNIDPTKVPADVLTREIASIPKSITKIRRFMKAVAANG